MLTYKDLSLLDVLQNKYNPHYCVVYVGGGRFIKVGENEGSVPTQAHFTKKSFHSLSHNFEVVYNLKDFGEILHAAQKRSYAVDDPAARVLPSVHTTPTHAPGPTDIHEDIFYRSVPF